MLRLAAKVLAGSRGDYLRALLCMLNSCCRVVTAREGVLAYRLLGMEGLAEAYLKWWVAVHYRNDQNKAHKPQPNV